MSYRSLVAPALAILLAPCTLLADPVLIRTSHALDDARGYCIDVAGFGPNARIDEPLRLHTCKYGAELGDQLFERAPGGNHIRLPEFNRCLAAEALRAGADLIATECFEAENQQWSFDWGQLRPAAAPQLCVTAAEGAGTPAGTPMLIAPVYRMRGVSLELCSDAAASRQSLRVGLPEEFTMSTVADMRAGIPQDIAARLEEWGNVFGMDQVVEMIPRVAALPRTYEPSEVEVIADVSYGPHRRHTFDIRRSTFRRSDGPVPVVILFHGGGLVGGSKDATAASADYFASLGYIGVNSNYRLAPENPWPAGPLDVGRAVTWLSENIAEYGGDPERIFVLGISSGSLHSAGYVFRADLMPEGTARAAGAILMSGPYTFDFATANESQKAYYGNDPAEYAHKVVPGNVTSTDIPVLFTTAEWDPPRYTNAFAELLHEVVIEHGVMPRYHQSIGHNHESQRGMLGTVEMNVAREIFDFIEQTHPH